MTFKKNVSFRDNKNNRYSISIELRSDGNISFSGEGNGHLGQCVDSIKPATTNQQQLVNMWNKYHLNGMKPGTKEQMDIVNKFKSKTYDETIKILKSYKIDGTELKVSELERFQKAFKEYQEENKFLINSKSLLDDIDDKGYIRFYKKSSKYDIPRIKSLLEEFKKRHYKQEIVVDEKENYLHFKYFSIDSLGLGQKNMLKRYKEFIDYKINNIEVPDDIYLSSHIVKKDGLPYQYGTSWITVPLPDDIEKQLDIIIDNINKESEEEQGYVINDNTLKSKEFQKTCEENDFDPEKIVALAKHLDFTSETLEYIEVDECTYTVEGSEYLVCNNDEANQSFYESTESLYDDIGFDGFNQDFVKESMTQNDNGDIVISKSITIKSNAEERGGALNHYDGNEHAIKVGSNEYYIYQR